MTASTSGPTAALAGISVGLQRQGLWVGRRQLFVCFAAEAETASMYTPDALARELERSLARSSFHSVSIAGWDPLASTEFLHGALERSAARGHGEGGATRPVMPPVMLDAVVNRPETIAAVARLFNLVQVTVDLSHREGSEPAPEGAVETLAAAALAGREHALVLVAGDAGRDAELLRLVERAHSASVGTKIVVHPPAEGERPSPVERRYSTLVERAMAIHPDVRLALRIPPPVGVR